MEHTFKVAPTISIIQHDFVGTLTIGATAALYWP